MAIRLSQRLTDMKDKNNKNNNENAVQLYDRMAIVKHKFNELNPDINMGTGTSYKTSISTDAYEYGKEKANDVSITTGIKKGNKETLELNR